MVENATIGQAVWIMKDNSPNQVWISTITTTQYANRTTTYYGYVREEEHVGKRSPIASDRPDVFFESKDALLDSFR